MEITPYNLHKAPLLPRVHLGGLQTNQSLTPVPLEPFGLFNQPERSAVEGPAVQRSTQGDEKRLLFSNYSSWKGHLSPCHPDRSAAQWRDLRFSGPFLGMFFDRSEA
jgi:hypothetical protein